METGEAFYSLLRPGERLLWSGQPDPDVLFAPADAFLVPFSLVWGGFALFWEFNVVTTSAPLFFKLWGLMFVAIGVYFVIGRFVYKQRKKRATRYAVTDTRAIILTNGSMSDVPLKHESVNIRRANRHATVVFGRSSRPGGQNYANVGLDIWPGMTADVVGFYDVADAEPMLRAVETARSA